MLASHAWLCWLCWSLVWDAFSGWSRRLGNTAYLQFFPSPKDSLCQGEAEITGKKEARLENWQRNKEAPLHRVKELVLASDKILRNANSQKAQCWGSNSKTSLGGAVECLGWLLCQTFYNEMSRVQHWTPLLLSVSLSISAPVLVVPIQFR